MNPKNYTASGKLLFDDIHPIQNHSVRPDWRHTLYWNPNILSQVGEEKIITCYTSDYTGDFIAVIEGVTVDGQGFRKTCRFSVIS